MLRTTWMVGVFGTLVALGCGEAVSIEDLGESSQAVFPQEGGSGGSAPGNTCQPIPMGGDGGGTPSDRTHYFSPAADSMLEQAASINQGALDYCQMKGGSNRRHCLIRWNLTNAPPAIEVKEACLKIEILDPSVSNYPGAKVLRNWSELQATWQQATTGNKWEAPGAWGPNDSGTTVVTIPANRMGVITIPISTEVVNEWLLDPSSNRGIVFGNDSSYDGASFATKENVNRGALLAIVK